jgi:hypothetical protein
MKILHLVKSEPSPLVKKIIETHSKSHEVKVINLAKKEASYETIIDEVASCDKLMSW